jgi:hypothetical protein
MEMLEEIRCTPAWRNNSNVQRMCAGTSRTIAEDIVPIRGMSAAEGKKTLLR